MKINEWQMKRCSIKLSSRKIQVKITTHLTRVIKNTNNIKCRQGR